MNNTAGLCGARRTLIRLMMSVDCRIDLVHAKTGGSIDRVVEGVTGLRVRTEFTAERMTGKVEDLFADAL